MNPRSMTMASLSTLATGARQLVVQLALETMSSSAVSVSWLTPNTIVFDTPVAGAEINGALKAAGESGPLKGILDYTDEPLVSIDLNHNGASSTVDSLETAVIEGKLVRVVSWYDNEWGFSNRMVDTAGAIAKLI